ncbi:MAG: hypothetical protein H6Q71_1718 [Firmicutes bacterium]|nr:hypothetical protein [Bacillota bacterium]
MNLLVEENMIELVKKTGKSTIYRITNYEKFNQQDNQEQDQEYQDVEEFDNQQDNQQITDRPPTDNQQTTNNEEGIRKIKKVKNKYGNFKNVLLTEDELFKLENEYGVGDTKTAIEYLSAYIEEKGYKSKSHNLAIRRWVFEASMNKKNKPKEQLPERKLAVL